MSKQSVKTKKPAKNLKSIPWDTIRAEFIADETLTQSVLARKYKVSRSSIQKKAKTENWQGLRNISTKASVEGVIENKTAQILDANKRHLEGAILIQQATLEGIRLIKNNEVEETLYFARDASPDHEEEKERKEKGRRYINGPVYYSKTLNELIRSYRIAADLERNVLGLANNINKFGDEDGVEQPIVYDIMGGATSGKRPKDTTDANPTAS